MAAQADRHRRDVKYQQGQLVLLSTKHLKYKDGDVSRKLMQPYCGPFPITRVINNNAYELELPPHMEIHRVINITQLRPFRDGTAMFPTRPKPDARPGPDMTDSNGAESYVVERILAHRGSGNTAKYLVLWQGYPYEEATWEPAEHLAGAAEQLSSYRKMLRSLPKRKRRRARTD